MAVTESRNLCKKRLNQKDERELMRIQHIANLQLKIDHRPQTCRANECEVQRVEKQNNIFLPNVVREFDLTWKKQNLG